MTGRGWAEAITMAIVTLVAMLVFYYSRGGFLP